MVEANRIQMWRNWAQLGVDHYSGLFEMVEKGGERAGVLKLFLLLGQKGIYLVKFNAKNKSLEQQVLTDELTLDVDLAEKLMRDAQIESLWADMMGTCGALGFDTVLIIVGAATAGAGGMAMIGWKVASAGINAIKCAMAWDAYESTKAGLPVFKATAAGKLMAITADIADIAVTGRMLSLSFGSAKRAMGLVRNDSLKYGRNIAEAVLLREGAKIGLVHLPNMVLKSANLLDSAKTLSANELTAVLQKACDRSTSTPYFDPWMDFEQSFQPFFDLTLPSYWLPSDWNSLK
jgi:hypothetical protein